MQNKQKYPFVGQSSYTQLYQANSNDFRGPITALGLKRQQINEERHNDSKNSSDVESSIFHYVNNI